MPLTTYGRRRLFDKFLATLGIFMFVCVLLGFAILKSDRSAHDWPVAVWPAEEAQ